MVKAWYLSLNKMKSARIIGDGIEKFFVSWWLGVRKDLEHHTGFTHYPMPFG